MKIDVYNHIIPPKFFHRMVETLPRGRDINKRVREIPSLVDLDERFRVMDEFEDYIQIVSLPAPPVEDYGPRAPEMARLANDEMAEIVARYPDRFLSFAAALPMNDPDALLEEARRAVRELGAAGVQVWSNVLGKPLTDPATAPLFDLMAELDQPIWIHPGRGADFADYKALEKSQFEIWWTFGWPYETSAAMTHIVMTGVFDRLPQLKIITHHMGGMIPYFAGRVGAGWDQLGSRTSDEDLTALLKKLKKRPLDYFKMFYADTALSGARPATECGLEFFGVNRTLFASDAPFDPEKGGAFIRWTIEVIDSLDITAEERHAIYEGNARRLLKLPQPAEEAR